MEVKTKGPTNEAGLCAPQKLGAVSPRWVAVAGVQFCIIFALLAMLAISAQGLQFWKNDSIQAREQLGNLEANLGEKREQIRNLELHILASRPKAYDLQTAESGAEEGARLSSPSQFDLLTALRDADYARYKQAAEPVLIYQSMASAFGK